MNERAVTSDLRDLHVRLFAAAKERAGSEIVTLTMPRDACIRDVREALADRFPDLRPLAAHLLFAIGTTYAGDEVAVPSTGEIVAFPPVSGG